MRTRARKFVGHARIAHKFSASPALRKRAAHRRKRRALLTVIRLRQNAFWKAYIVWMEQIVKAHDLKKASESRRFYLALNRLHEFEYAYAKSVLAYEVVSATLRKLDGRREAKWRRRARTRGYERPRHQPKRSKR